MRAPLVRMARLEIVTTRLSPPRASAHACSITVRRGKQTLGRAHFGVRHRALCLPGRARPS